jgi:hypothetical protein
LLQLFYNATQRNVDKILLLLDFITS